MDRIKDLLSIVIGSDLIIEGTGRTYVKAPLWLVVLAAIASLTLAAITTLLIIAFGMRVRVVKR